MYEKNDKEAHDWMESISGERRESKTDRQTGRGADSQAVRCRGVTKNKAKWANMAPSWIVERVRY